MSCTFITSSSDMMVLSSQLRKGRMARPARSVMRMQERSVVQLLL